MTQPENNDGNSAVQLTHVTRTYKRDEFEVRALDDVTLDIPRKSFLANMGPSGSGKTTLLNLVTGIDHPTSGRVAVGGRRNLDHEQKQLSANHLDWAATSGMSPCSPRKDMSDFRGFSMIFTPKSPRNDKS